ncbi:MAG: ubiquinone biosynthesis protein [Blastocatellia bacterium]|jgi:predicted unusual protein kinase regulating ubiquinone biosynthesis (AarF/ABC1/UbiB family)|nr:ubiquinone biosynthesis protein [Blastocatellia bacterium]
MGISLKPEYLKRYKDIAWLLMKYGRSDLVKQAGLEDALDDESDVAQVAAPEAEELSKDLERMGPTFVKLAQLLSTRADMLPVPYLEALSRLQDDVAPFSFGEVEQIVMDELGVRLSKAFAEFEAEPLAAASLGQAHRARLRDGREVVVKVQRPGVREVIVKDLEILLEVAAFLDKHTEMGKRYEFTGILTELRKSLLRELDYKQEARHLVTFAANLREFERLVLPAPVADYTTSRVLTMDFITGKKITSLSPLARMDLDGYGLAEHFFRAYLKQLLVDGLFHADPHPGNVFITDDERIALLDLGMVGRLTPRFQENLLQLLLAISEGHGDEVSELTIKMGEPKDSFEAKNFQQRVKDLVAQHQGANLENINSGRVVLEITRISGECGFRLPPEFTLIAKTLLNLDQVVHTLDPAFDPNASIRQNATELLRERMVKSISPGNLFNTLLETKGFVEKLPGRVNRLFDAIANNEMQIRVDAIDEVRLMEGLQKIANRITMGLVLAALIVGAALLMRVETSFKILGYPGIAMIFFFIAAAAGMFLVFHIFLNDVKKEKKDGPQ